jgi:hypothetical protein
MRIFFGGFAVAALVLTVPASASIAYSDGPINGTIDGWTLSAGFQVADTFTLGSAETMTGVTFGAWTLPGDTVTNIDWAIVLDPTNIAGSTLDSGAGAAVTQTFDGTSGGSFAGLYNLDYETFSLPDLNLGPGIFWLVLENAVSAEGNSVYWDENDGPSEAWGNTTGYLTPANESCSAAGSSGYCSQAFSIDNNLPEPGTTLLFATGLIGLGLVRRRKIRS